MVVWVKRNPRSSGALVKLGPSLAARSAAPSDTTKPPPPVLDEDELEKGRLRVLRMRHQNQQMLGRSPPSSTPTAPTPPKPE